MTIKKRSLVSPFAIVLSVMAVSIVPSATASDIDCNTMITAAEIEAACGIKVREVKKHFSETGQGINTCVRNASPKAGEGVLMRIAKESDTSRASSLMKMSYKGSAFSGLGDEARFHERLEGFGPERSVVARKGVYFVEFKNHWMRKKKPACTKDQLSGLVKKVLNRLP